MIVTPPMVNAGMNYINGLELTWLTTTTISVAAGLCRDSTNVNDISVGLPLPVEATQTGVEPVADGTGAVTIDTTVSGAGGLDTGTIAASTFYAVYAIGDSYSGNPGSALISADLETPLLPVGYNMFFRIGYVKTDGSSHFLAFRQVGAGLDRWMWYDAPIATGVTNGSSATYASVDCSAGLPAATPTMVNFYCVFSPTGTNDKLVLVPGTSTATLGYATLSGTGAAVTGNLVCPTDAPLTDAIDYKVTGSATAISVAAYLDQLSR
jgi:hypothetical protein